MKKSVLITTAQGNRVVLCPCHISSISCDGGIRDDNLVVTIHMTGGEKYQYVVVGNYTEREAIVSVAKSLGLG